MTHSLDFLFENTSIIVNAVIIIIATVCFTVYKSRQHQAAELLKEDPPFLSLSLQRSCYHFSLKQIRRATSDFHDELVIGEGGFGKVYKGTFENGPTVVAIKRSQQSKSGQGSTEFQAEIETLSRLRHSHLVSLIGYCDEVSEMILVYEFMPGGTLADHLYKRVRQGDTSLSPLSWIQRLKICIGAARGLDYLHTGTGIQNRIIHRDVKSTNILIDENFAAKMSDFGLSKTSPANQADTFISTHVRGTFGYFDPYYFQTHRLTRKSDVYAFGVVLFEVLCGRPAVDKSLDEEQMGLAGWALHCFREQRLGEIIDPEIKENVYPDSLETFVKVAIQCLCTGPKDRPTMAEVVVGLESALALQEKSTENFSPEIITSNDNQEEIDISDHELENENLEDELSDISSSRHQEKKSSPLKRFVAFLTPTAWPISVNKEAKTARNSDGALPVILQSSNLKIYTFHDLSIATRKFHPDSEFGRGAHHKVYKGYIDENTFAATKWGTGLVTTIKIVKNLKGYEEGWLTEINILGKLCHPNIVKLFGYCLKKKHRILVLEYAPQGGLDTHLFRRDSDFQPLSWKLRISIALGAAKGLAYLHSPGVDVIHCDVKSSNILIDSEYNAKLSNFGLAKDGPDDERTHVSTAAKGTIGYIDPEYIHTGHLTMKSDVFSFGVVLLEMLTGRRAILNIPPENRTLFSWAESFLSKEHGSLDIMDAEIKGQYTIGAASAASSLALRCTSLNSKSRPDAKQVAEELEQLLDLVNLDDINNQVNSTEKT